MSSFKCLHTHKEDYSRLKTVRGLYILASGKHGSSPRDYVCKLCLPSLTWIRSVFTLINSKTPFHTVVSAQAACWSSHPEIFFKRLLSSVCFFLQFLIWCSLFFDLFPILLTFHSNFLFAVSKYLFFFHLILLCCLSVLSLCCIFTVSQFMPFARSLSVHGSYCFFFWRVFSPLFIFCYEFSQFHQFDLFPKGGCVGVLGGGSEGVWSWCGSGWVLLCMCLCLCGWA